MLLRIGHHTGLRVPLHERSRNASPLLPVILVVDGEHVGLQEVKFAPVVSVEPLFFFRSICRRPAPTRVVMGAIVRPLSGRHDGVECQSGSRELILDFSDWIVD